VSGKVGYISALWSLTNIDAQMHGCSPIQATCNTDPVNVDCTVVFNSNSGREADHLRRSVSFLVSDGLISRVSIVELESPLDEDSDLDGLFDRWLKEFYFPGP